jgi:[ribosomal protein S5]-alanine N-acetyltransferase
MEVKAPVLVSERLKLTPLGLDHYSESYVSWLNDPRVNQFMESGGDYTLEKLHDFLKEVETSNILFWAIHLKESHKHIGNIKIDPINLKHRYAEYGIMIGDRHEWGKGYAKEATILVINFCFSKIIDLRKVNLGVHAKNTGAVELYKKIGFNVEGCFKQHVETNDGYDDVFRMAIFNSEYEK